MKPFKLGFALLGMILALLPTAVMRGYMNNLPVSIWQYFDGIIWAFGGACVGFGTSSIIFRLFSHDLSENVFRWLFVGYCWLAVVVVQWWCLQRNTEEQQFVFNLFNNWGIFITLGVMVAGGLVGFVLDAIRHKLNKGR